MKTAVQKSASQINLDNFFHELRRVNNTYPEDGGRERLYELVGNGYKLYIYLHLAFTDKTVLNTFVYKFTRLFCY